MFAPFIADLRAAGIKVSTTEHLTLLEAMKRGVARLDVEDFYYLARAALVKDERLIDRFDRVFISHFRGVESLSMETLAELPAEWLRRLAEKWLTPEELDAIQRLGGLERIIETLRQRLAEQKDRHQGGSKWIGTGGTSPFGAYGANPEGVRIGQDTSRMRRAVKVWDKREFRDLDGNVEMGARAMKLALRRLRRWGREGEADELDIGGTIRATAANAGLLDLKLRPQRRNKVKVLLLVDIGGSMEDHVEESAMLFSAARAEFKNLETFYFHNCPYERLWRTNRRRFDQATPTQQVINTYGKDWRLVIVGDATMGPFEITEPGGSIEHWNEESGATWMARLLGHYGAAAWINPRDQRHWEYTASINLMRDIMGGRMFSLTLDGLEDALKALKRTR